LHPGQRVVAKYFTCRRNRLWIIKRADSNDNCTGCAARLFPDSGSAFRAKEPENRLTAATRAGERFHRTCNRQTLLWDENQSCKRAAREFLTISTMAHYRLHGFCGSRITHRTAKATSCDCRHFPVSPAIFHMLGPSGHLGRRMPAALDARQPRCATVATTRRPRGALRESELGRFRRFRPVVPRSSVSVR